jgi:hypothetical protein
MTEAEWAACTDPGRMLEFLRGKASGRKLRLLAVAFCRRVWRHINDKRCRRAVDVVERFADGRASIEKLRAAEKIASEAACFPPSGISHSAELAWHAARYATRDRDYALWCAHSAVEAVRWEASADHDPDAAAGGERRAQSDLLRCVFGNPLRTSPPIPSALLAWNEATVHRIAQGIYTDRAFGRLPILADALLDAGCEDEELLAHCHSTGPHFRGCWAVDLILGKG